MIEIIPNWHPVFVHFAIGLLTISTVFHVIAAIKGKSTNYYQFENVANWNLWVGALLAVVTVITGWLAYNSVDHDTPSHLAMTDHRNWAMVTAGIFVAIAIWSYMRAKKSLPIGWGIAIVMLVAAGLLTATGWKGGELVYRHGLGVMSLPSKSEHDHAAHDHGTEAQDGGHSHDTMEESEHEVGEADHGHDHEHENQDMASESEDSAMSDANEEPAEAAEKVPEKKDDGHTHDHNHGDHPH